jgi:hypothetical protein
MSRAQNPNPTRRYVNCFLMATSQQDEPRHFLRKSRGLPRLEAYPDIPTPSFERFRNRLKVMADLDPVRYPTRQAGRFELCTHVEQDGGLREAHFTVHVVFDDASTDPEVELRFEPLSQVFYAGGNPFLY